MSIRRKTRGNCDEYRGKKKNLQLIIETEIDSGDRKRVHSSFGVVNA